ncbi:unnamed protein product [Euphydryas editha]|uniref:Ketosynthase family 3 (KS3) domain-containing protein n=1 Tax=Euphydryas editha TaxID=104508 RepID=A0AAU9U3K2_EUPED|nr:unnamed protein product [Euphydryas editha]
MFGNFLTLWALGHGVIIVLSPSVRETTTAEISQCSKINNTPLRFHCITVEDVYKNIYAIKSDAIGTKAGDPEELNAIDEIMCIGRSEPLLLGSIKSNLGHTEPAAGICAVTKLCIAYSTGYIPPNINYKVPRKGVSALEEGRLKVVTEKQLWGRGLSGINNFGFGGANAHILLKNVARFKVNNGLPIDDVPRLVCVSGITYSAVARILDDIESRTVDIDLIRLLHEIHNDDIKGHFYRGYTLLGSTPTNSVSLARNIQYFSGVRRQVCFVYTCMVQGSQWTRIARQLMKIHVFASAIESHQQIHQVTTLGQSEGVTSSIREVCVPKTPPVSQKTHTVQKLIQFADGSRQLGFALLQVPLAQNEPNEEEHPGALVAIKTPPNVCSVGVQFLVKRFIQAVTPSNLSNEL